MANDDFFSGMKSEKDRAEEWAASAQFFVDIRRTNEPEVVEPLPETEKLAGFREVGQAILSGAKKADPTGLTKSMATKPGAIAGLAGGALFGLGTALSSRGKKELGGKSGVEDYLMKAKEERDKQPEPKSLRGKLFNNFADLSTGIASTARKHPVAAGAVGAVGGAKLFTGLLGSLSRKAVTP